MTVVITLCAPCLATCAPCCRFFFRHVRGRCRRPLVMFQKLADGPIGGPRLAPANPQQDAERDLEAGLGPDTEVLPPAGGVPLDVGTHAEEASRQDTQTAGAAGAAGSDGSVHSEWSAAAAASPESTGTAHFMERFWQHLQPPVPGVRDNRWLLAVRQPIRAAPQLALSPSERARVVLTPPLA